VRAVSELSVLDDAIHHIATRLQLVIHEVRP
jgi:hypothetical protein